MKRIVLFIVASVLCICMSNAQTLNSTNINAYKVQVENKVKTFCKYVAQVGTSAGQAGAVTDDTKTDIIRNRVPGLFLDYYEAPRKMITTYGPNGRNKRERKMSDYFDNLKDQSRRTNRTARKYELRFVDLEGGFTYDGVWSDGGKVWSTKAKIRQKYHKYDLGTTADGRIVDQIETTVKVQKVYLFVKPNGKAVVKLGDIIEAYNE